MDRTNAEWIDQLGCPGSRREAALADLRAQILRGLRGALGGRAGVDDGFLEDIAQESLLRVLDRLSTFEGRCQFVTWAMSVAVRLALTGLRKRRCNDVSLDQVVAGQDRGGVDVVDPTPGPERLSLRGELLAALARVVREDLTPIQQAVLTAELNGLSPDEIARQFGSNRNAIYKLTHDARRKLRAGLEAAGFDGDSLLRACGP